MANFKLIQEGGKLKIQSRFGNDTIHVIHCCENLEEIKEECEYSYDPFMVVEEFGNFGRVHLITAQSEDEAIQGVYEYIQEKECEDLDSITDIHLICVEPLEMCNFRP